MQCNKLKPMHSETNNFLEIAFLGCKGCTEFVELLWLNAYDVAKSICEERECNCCSVRSEIQIAEL